jgi:S1-C subfamily serine protease
MNRLMKIVMIVLLAETPLLATAADAPAAVSKQPPVAAQTDDASQNQDQLEKELDQARQALQAAAQKVARLSMQLNEPDVQDMVRIRSGGPHFKHGAVLGITLEGDGSDTGVDVGGVTPGGPADKAGLRADDIITAINGATFKSTDDTSADEQLMKFMDSVKPGDSLKVAYTRDGKPATATVVAGNVKEYRRSFGYDFDMPPMPLMPALTPRAPMPPRLDGHDHGFGFYFDSDRPWGEMQLVPLTSDLGQYFGTDKGLLVVRAAKDAKLQLKDGDVITAIGGRDPGSPSHAMRILGSYGPGESIKLDIMRKGKPVSLNVSLPKSKDDTSVTGVFSMSGSDDDDDDAGGGE